MLGLVPPHTALNPKNCLLPLKGMCRNLIVESRSRKMFGFEIFDQVWSIDLFVEFERAMERVSLKLSLSGLIHFSVFYYSVVIKSIC